MVRIKDFINSGIIYKVLIKIKIYKPIYLVNNSIKKVVELKDSKIKKMIIEDLD